MTSECGRETVDVEKSPGVEGMKSGGLLQFVMQDDDDNVSTVVSCRDSAPANTFVNVPLTPTHRVSNKFAISPSKASRMTVASDETVISVKGCSSGSGFDPCFILESPLVKKSPSKTARRAIDVEDLPVPSDGSAAGQLPASATDILVCVTDSISMEFHPFGTNSV